MIKFRELKERMGVLPCITIKGAYNIYSNDVPGIRHPKKYLGYVTVKRGKATHYPTQRVTDSLDELCTLSLEWSDTSEHEASTYCPDLRKGYRDDIRLHDHLVGLGFKPEKNTYILQLSYAISGRNAIRLRYEVIDRLDNDNYSIKCTIDVDQTSYIDLSGADYDDVSASIDFVVRVLMLDAACNSYRTLEKVKSCQCVDDIVMKTIDIRSFDIKESSYKEHLIKTLRKTLDELEGKSAE